MVSFGVGRLSAFKRGAMIAVIGLAVPALAACGGSSSTSTDTGGSSGGGNKISMTNDNFFKPNSLEITAGTKVTWDNQTAVQHSVTFDPSLAADKAHAATPAGTKIKLDSGLLDPKKTYDITFDVPGTYKYFCQPHEGTGMFGTIVVK